MVEISLSGSGEGLGRVIARGYSTIHRSVDELELVEGPDGAGTFAHLEFTLDPEGGRVAKPERRAAVAHHQPRAVPGEAPAPRVVVLAHEREVANWKASAPGSGS